MFQRSPGTHRLRTERHSSGSENWLRRRGGVQVGRSVGIIGSGKTGRTCSESVAVHDSETCPFLGPQPVADVTRAWPIPPHFGIYRDNSSHPEIGGSTYGVTQNKRFTRCRTPKDGHDLKYPLWKRVNYLGRRYRNCRVGSTTCALSSSSPAHVHVAEQHLRTETRLSVPLPVEGMSHGNLLYESFRPCACQTSTVHVCSRNIPATAVWLPRVSEAPIQGVTGGTDQTSGECSLC